MPWLWIVHREPAQRAALARLASASPEAPSGAPGAALFDSAAAPDAVLLGLAGDLESELEFAHRTAARLRGTTWILLGDADRLERARRLFDALPAEWFAYPPQPGELRRALREAAASRAGEPLPLSQRPARDALSERFSRGFADLELPELLRSLDPRLAGVPLLVLGEPGSGRGTLARYVHHFGPTAGGALVELACTPGLGAAELLAEIAAADRDRRVRRACSLWLEDADRLAAAVQRRVRSWIEYGLPPGSLRSPQLRWIGTARADALEPELARALGGLTLRIPPLRERARIVPNLANAAALAWCAARGLRPRRLGEHALAVLEEYPWPGNLAELEAVVAQSLAASGADPLGPEDLVLDGAPFASLASPAAGREPALAEPELEPGPPAASGSLPIDEILDALEEAELEPEAEPPQPDTTAQSPPPGERSLQRLAAAVGHEVRNPLTAVRTFAELLPQRHADPGFREHFARLARESLVRVDEVLARLEQLAGFPAPQRRTVDVSRLLEEVLEKRRGRIHERRLVVLEELDRRHPSALCDPEQLRFAFEALLDKSLELVPERGDLYLASRRHDSGLRGEPCLRVLLRYRGPDASAGGPQLPDASPAANALEFAMADLLVRAQGGSLALDTSDRNETVVVLDLPA